MKRLLPIVWILLCPIILDAQVELHPIYTSPHMGKGAKFSEDGSKIVTWCGFGFSVWDAKTNTILYTITGHEGIINYAEFNHKGTAIVTASEDNKAKVWNAKNGKLLNTLQSHKDWVCYAKFNVTDHRLITKSEDGKVIVWSISSDTLFTKIKEVEGYVYKADFSSNGSHIILREINGIIHLANSKDAVTLHTFHLSDGCLEDVVFEESNNSLIAIYEDFVRIIPVEKSFEYQSPQPSNQRKVPCNRMGFRSNCKVHTCNESRSFYDYRNHIVIFYNSRDTVKMVNAITGITIKQFYVPNMAVEDIYVNNSGESIYITTQFGALKKINCISGTVENILERNGLHVVGAKSMYLDYDKNTDRILCICDRVTSFVSCDELNTITMLKSEMKSGVIDSEKGSKDNFYMYNKIHDSVIVLCSEDNDKVCIIKQPEKHAEVISYNRVSKTVVMKSPSLITMYNSGTGTLFRSIALKRVVEKNVKRRENDTTNILSDFIDYIGISCVVDDNATNVLFNINGALKIWNINLDSLQFVNEQDKSMSMAHFDSKGHYFAYVQEDNKSVQICETTSLKPKLVLSGHTKYIRSIEFDKSSRYIITCSEDSTARIYDLMNEGTVTILKGHKGRVNDARFNNKGNCIVTAGSDGKAYIWSMSGEKIATLTGSKSYLYNTYFSDDDTKIVTHSGDGVTRVYDVTQLLQ